MQLHPTAGCAPREADDAAAPLASQSGREVARRGAGEIFGEMGIFEDTLRQASVIASEPCVCAVLRRVDLFRLIDTSSPKVRAIFDEVIAERRGQNAGDAPPVWSDLRQSIELEQQQLDLNEMLPELDQVQPHTIGDQFYVKAI